MAKNSKFDEVVTIGEAEYNFQLLSLKHALRIESQVLGLISGAMGKSDMDYDLLYDIGVKICSGLLIDGFEINDLDEHFKGRALLFNQVIIQGLKVNFPDFFLKINALGSNSVIKTKLSEAGINL